MIYTVLCNAVVLTLQFSGVEFVPNISKAVFQVGDLDDLKYIYF